MTNLSGCVARVSFIPSWLPASHLNDWNRNAAVSSTLNLKIWSFLNTTGVSSRIEKSLDDQKLHQTWATYKTWHLDTFRLVMSQVLLKYSNQCPTVYRIRGTSCRLRPQQHGRCTWTLGDAAVDSLRCRGHVCSCKPQGQISSDIHRYPCFEMSWRCSTWFCTLRLRIYLSTFQLSTRANWSNPLWLARDHHPCIGPIRGNHSNHWFNHHLWTMEQRQEGFADAEDQLRQIESTQNVLRENPWQNKTGLLLDHLLT